MGGKGHVCTHCFNLKTLTTGVSFGTLWVYFFDVAENGRLPSMRGPVQIYFYRLRARKSGGHSLWITRFPDYHLFSQKCVFKIRGKKCFPLAGPFLGRNAGIYVLICVSSFDDSFRVAPYRPPLRGDVHAAHRGSCMF